MKYAIFANTEEEHFEGFVTGDWLQEMKDAFEVLGLNFDEAFLAIEVPDEIIEYRNGFFLDKEDIERER